MDSDNEEMMSSSSNSRASRKSSLISRLQSGQSLQICFMNENVSDITGQVSTTQPLDCPTISCVFDQESDDHSEEDAGLTDANNSLDNSRVTTEPNNVETSPNNNSCLDITNSFKTIDISLPKRERPSHLFTKLGFGSLNLDEYHIFEAIPKPTEKEQFQDYHSRLHAEARHALAQVYLYYSLLNYNGFS